MDRKSSRLIMSIALGGMIVAIALVFIFTSYSGQVPADFWSNAIYSVIPTLAVGLLFWFILRAIIRSDSAERKAYAKIEAQERARLAKAADRNA